MMQSMRHDSYCDTYDAGSRHSIPQREEDTQAVASFLLALKHRSVTPDSHSHDSESNQSTARSSYQSYAGGSHEEDVKSFVPSAPPSSSPISTPMPESDVDMPWEELLDASKLVKLKDRDLVPDALFVAMAQMKQCRLTMADRVGCYKTREIGFVGMCCKHCGGQPGFGRYYPNSVRSLAQTTTSQTILKHVGSKCRFCPKEVREAVLELQRQQAVREGMSSGRPRYGSRKIFFQRVWNRLHGGPNTAEDDDESKATTTGDVSDQTPSDYDEETSTVSGEYDAEVAAASGKRKNNSRIGSRSLQPSKRIKLSNTQE